MEIPRLTCVWRSPRHLSVFDESEDESYDLCISNYAFSELSEAIAERYADLFFGKCRAGYLIWNYGLSIDEWQPKLEARIQAPILRRYLRGADLVTWGVEMRIEEEWFDRLRTLEGAYYLNQAGEQMRKG